MAEQDAPCDHRAIDEGAAAWLARRDRGEWTNEDDVDLTEWLNESTAHRVAFLRLESVWEGACRARALSSPFPGIVPPPKKSRESPFFQPIALQTPGAPPRRKARLRWTIAAAVLLVIGIGGMYVFDLFVPGNVYSTSVGGISSIALSDGSTITLNTASRIRIQYAPKERRIVLEQGEAYFSVRKDPGRPFVVVAGDQRIVDVGTQFSVRRDPAGVRIVVTEGVVQLVPSGGGEVPTLSPNSLAEIGVRLSAGAVAIAQNGELFVHKESVRQATELMSWRTGYLTFEDTTLADAVAEFNRYNLHHISIEDPQVAGIRISGTFRATDYLAFVRLLHDGYSVRVRDTDEGITLGKE